METTSHVPSSFFNSARLSSSAAAITVPATLVSRIIVIHFIELSSSRTEWTENSRIPSFFWTNSLHDSDRYAQPPTHAGGGAETG
jgi:hypothetical protein